MLDGVVVDDLTRSFLGLSTDREQGDELYRALRVFFHDARNRLNALKLGLYLVRRGTAEPDPVPIWEELDLSYRGLEQLIERLQTLCRPLEHDPSPGDLGAWFEERRPIWSEWFLDRGRRLHWRAPACPAQGCFDAMRLIHALDALISWRSGEVGEGGGAELGFWADATHFHVEWSERETPIGEPLEGRDGRSVSMALPLLARVMTAHGGSMAVGNHGGLLIRLAWPLEAVSHVSA